VLLNTQRKSNAPAGSSSLGHLLTVLVHMSNDRLPKLFFMTLK